MVASLSARGSASAALAYYDHLRADDYYTRDGEPPGRWMGQAADRLSLNGPVTQSEFESALQGRDPKTGQSLTRQHGPSHAAGWDMTFSAPKSVSVVWALSESPNRERIVQAHQGAITAAARSLEQTAAFTRRGPGGRIHEPTAGLLMAAFDHHTSRELDPQLHTHCFIFNLAPRQDGSWGSIVSRELYRTQKAAGQVYRAELANGLERLGYALDRQADTFRIAAIPLSVERDFSKRRQAIEEAARTHGYATPKGMELAALRTRRAKQSAKLADLFRDWQSEAKALGFMPQRDAQHHGRQWAHEAGREERSVATRDPHHAGEVERSVRSRASTAASCFDPQRVRQVDRREAAASDIARDTERRADDAHINPADRHSAKPPEQMPTGAAARRAAHEPSQFVSAPSQSVGVSSSARRFGAVSPTRAASSTATGAALVSAAQLGSLLGQALSSLDQPNERMAGVRIKLHGKEQSFGTPGKHDRSQDKDRDHEYE
ncbi:MAG: relaxase domain-containing protein [Alphaproteobacteria bacterium]|nr:relaxase domain-containing protein [Alphaproteobacteria bacterium]